MEFSLQKELPGRLRVKLAGPVPAADLDALERVVLASAAVLRVTVYPRIGSLAVVYRPGEGNRRQVLAHLESIDAAAIDGARVAGGIALAPRTQSLLMELAVMIGSYAVRRWFLPRPLAAVVAAWRYRRFLMPALRSLRRARLDVPVLDAAIGMSFARRDPKTAGETMFLLDAGETLEEYTRSRSEGALISALLDIPETAQRIEGDTEARVAATALEPGDLAFFFPNTVHAYQSGGEGSHIMLIAASSLLGDLFPTLTRFRPAEPVLRAAALHPDMGYAIQRLSREGVGGQEVRRALLHLILARILEA